MISNKPYLIRAFYQWIIDSGCTPHIVLKAYYPKCSVPEQFIDENGEITFNLSPQAIRDLKIGNEFIEFIASFSGIVRLISFPVGSVVAIYAEEDEESGTIFEVEEVDFDVQQNIADIEKTNNLSTKKVSHLKLVE